MPVIFSDEDLMYLDKEHDDQLQSIKRLIDDRKSKGDPTFCRKCGHLMEYFTVGNAKLLQCGFCGNRVAEVIKL
jgi:hypothetical protein